MSLEEKRKKQRIYMREYYRKHPEYRKGFGGAAFLMEVLNENKREKKENNC